MPTTPVRTRPGRLLLALPLLLVLAPAIAHAEDPAAASSPPREQILRTYALQHADVGDVMTLLRAVGNLAHVAADEERRLITVRDAAERVALADEIVARHDRRPSEIKLRLEILAVPTDGVVRTASTKHVDAAGARHLIDTDLGLRGNGAASLRLEHGGSVDDGVLRSLGIDVQGSVDGDGVVLDLKIEIGTVQASGSPAGASTRSTWRTADGVPLLIELPLGFGAPDGHVLMARVTPTVTGAGEARSAQLLGPAGTAVPARASR